MKTCSICHKSYPATPEYFYRCRGNPDGLEYRCKECKKIIDSDPVRVAKLRLLTKKWQSRNKDRIRLYQIEHREQTRTKVRKYREKHREEAKEYSRKYLKRHPGFSKRNSAIQRGKSSGNGGSFTAEEWIELCRKYNWRCLCCGKRKKLEMDHIVPVVKGGSSNIENIQPLCRDCNHDKFTKTIDYRVEWEIINGKARLCKG